MAKELTGSEIREGIQLAKTDIDAVDEEIRAIARQNRVEVLKGPDRQEFFRGMKQEEFDTLHDMARALGPNGVKKLEQLMGEASGVFAEDSDD